MNFDKSNFLVMLNISKFFSTSTWLYKQIKNNVLFSYIDQINNESIWMNVWM